MQILMPVFVRGQILFYLNCLTANKLFRDYREKGLVDYYYGDHNGHYAYFITQNPYLRIEDFYNQKVKGDRGTAVYKEFCNDDFNSFVLRLNTDWLPQQSELTVKTKTFTLKLEKHFEKISLLTGATFTGISRSQKMHWTREMIARVNQLYADDFRRFGYEKL